MIPKYKPLSGNLTYKIIQICYIVKMIVINLREKFRVYSCIFYILKGVAIDTFHMGTDNLLRVVKALSI